MKKFKLLISAIAAGIAIGIGGAVFLSLDNKIVGALFFSLGLLTVVSNGLALFTGKVGYLPMNKPSYLIDLVIIWVGNYIGATLTGLLFHFTRAAKVDKAMSIVQAKLDDNLISVFILSVFCGILMFLAVNGYKKISDWGRYLILVLPVAVFILSGYEHCVANMFYYAHALVFSPKAFVLLAVMTLGNSVGGVLAGLYEKKMV